MASFERFDDYFTTVAHGVNGIENLMDTFFGFLERKTDFYEGALSDKADAAKEVTLKYYLKHKEPALDRIRAEKLRNRKIDEERKKRNAEEKNNEFNNFHLQQEILKKGPQIEEVFDDHSQSPTPENHPQKTTNAKIEGDEEENDGPRPIGNGGQTDKYTWTQVLSSLDVYVPVPPGTSSKMCKVTMTPTTLKIVVAGGGVPIIDGKLHAGIKVDDSLWTLIDNKLLHLTLEKKDGMRWWSCVMKGDPEIDTRKIVPENSKLNELDPELRTTVEKMMYDQEMKSKGLPTSDQSKQAQILENFKKSHPELDFSKANINWGNAPQF